MFLIRTKGVKNDSEKGEMSAGDELDMPTFLNRSVEGVRKIVFGIVEILRK